MATYKVPQDVEADDKLIGPFSFRQFIYLIIVALAGVAAWGLAQLFIFLVILPLPIILFFGALALPLRKDQPMEIYMAALVSFYLKPRSRLWQADGIESLIEITVPKTVEARLTKDISVSEAEKRLGYLAEIVDSQGWSVRGVDAAPMNTAVAPDLFIEAQQAPDVFDAGSAVAQSFTQMMNQSDARHHQQVIDQLHQPPVQTIPTPESTGPQFLAADPQGPAPTFNPYPTNMHQTVIQPVGDTRHQATVISSPAPKSDSGSGSPHTSYSPPTPDKSANSSETVVSPDIINLANNADLSIETIAREANRIQHKHQQEDAQDEVVISLR